NGSLSQFGLRFWDYVGDHIDGLAAIMGDDSIQVASVRYSDRYLQSPAYILLLASLLEPILVKMKSHDATIFTMFKDNDRLGSKIYHDWCDQEHFRDFTLSWLKERNDIFFDLEVADSNREIPHGRKLEVSFSNGVMVRIRFDQGVGYWRFDRSPDFNFSKEVEELVDELISRLSTLSVRNSESWET